MAGTDWYQTLQLTSQRTLNQYKKYSSGIVRDTLVSTMVSDQGKWYSGEMRSDRVVRVGCVRFVSRTQGIRRFPHPRWTPSRLMHDVISEGGPSGVNTSKMSPTSQQRRIGPGAFGENSNRPNIEQCEEA